MGDSPLGIPASGEPCTSRSNGDNRLFEFASPVAKRLGIFQEDSIHSIGDRRRAERSRKKPLRVMKFGGTSVGDASCIGKVVEIIRAASRDSHIVVVVSAMSGVTNQLIESAIQSEAGNRDLVATIFDALRKQHDAAAASLVQSGTERKHLGHRMHAIFDEGDHLCQGTILLRELTPRARDSISSLGERLSAPLVAATLAEHGVASEAIDATDFIVTDSCHGAAEPRMDLTRERCQARLRPLLQQGIVPVITGFIGATEEGVLTTLGRGGSDYSATILGSVLDADEVIIWTDVDGVLTADPRLVPGASTISEISYREAAELAYFGAKVLHPATIQPAVGQDIPVRILNSHRPQDAIGTLITRDRPPSARPLTAVAAKRGVTVVDITSTRMLMAHGFLRRIFDAFATYRTSVDVVTTSEVSVSVTIDDSRRLDAVIAALADVADVAREDGMAIVCAVGDGLQHAPGFVGDLLSALGSIPVRMVSQAAARRNITLVIREADLPETLTRVHDRFFAPPADVVAAGPAGAAQEATS
jgi:aspartate kinase